MQEVAEGAHITIHSTLAEALASLDLPPEMSLQDLFPEAPATARYAVVADTSTGKASGHVEVPLTADVTGVFGASSARSVRTGVIVAFVSPEFSAANIKPAFTMATVPEPGTAYVLELAGTIDLSAGAKFGYSYNWLRHIRAAEISGDLGLTIDADTSVNADLTLSGDFVVVVARDGAGWVRSRVHKNRNKGFEFASHIAAGARAVTPELPPTPDKLLAAILGVHEQQWLQALERGIAKLPAGVALEQVQRLMHEWSALDGRTAAVIWKYADRQPKIEELRNWVSSVCAELPDQGTWKLAVQRQLQDVPDFPDLPAGEWTEAAAGSLLTAMSGAEAFQRLSLAAEQANHLLSEPGLTEVLGKLKQHAVEQFGLDKLSRALQDFADFQKLDEWAQGQIAAFFKEVVSEKTFARMQARLRPLFEMRQKIYDRALAALGKTWSAELSAAYQTSDASTALLDCSFDLSAEPGKAGYGAALQGHFATPAENESGVRFHHAVLTHERKRRTHVELHLPFLGPMEWEVRLDVLAKADVRDDADGRVFAYSVKAEKQLTKKAQYQSTLALAGSVGVVQGVVKPDFSLTYSETRELTGTAARAAALMLEPVIHGYGFPPDAGKWLATATWQGKLERVLTLAVPGTLVSAWLRAPVERKDPNFVPVYSRVAAETLRAVRLWLPTVYFHDWKKYGDLEAAMPLVVYQCSEPLVGKLLYYDAHSLDSRRLAVGSAAPRLAAELARIEQLLRETGGRAEFWAPRQASRILRAVSEDRFGLFQVLLRGDAFFVDRLVELGKAGGQLGRSLAGSPGDVENVVKGLSGFAVRFVEAFEKKRLYGDVDFLPFGSLLLVTATRALAGRSDAAVGGVLRLEAEGLKQTFVNSELLKS